MKTLALILTAMLTAALLQAQQTLIPDVDLRDINGEIISAQEITSPGNATLMVFWKSSGGKCCENLETIRSAWEETLALYGVKMVAVCVDCNGAWTQVKPIVYGNDWDFDTYIDVNGDLKRELNIGELPCTLLFDNNQNLICRYSSSCTVSQEFICGNVLAHLNYAPADMNYNAAK